MVLIAVLIHTPVLYSRGCAALDIALLNDKVSETRYKPFHACSTFIGFGWSVRLVLGRCVKCCRLTWECVYCSFVRSVVSLCIYSAQQFLLIVCGSYLVNLFNYYICVSCKWPEKCHLRCIISFSVVLYLVLFPHPYKSVGMAVIWHTRGFSSIVIILNVSKFILKHL